MTSSRESVAVSQIRVSIRYGEGETARSVTTGTTAGEALGGDRSVIAARVGGVLRDLNHTLLEGDLVEPVLASSDDGLAIIRHSCAHVMAQAVQELFPQARLGMGPPIKDGFYYDFDVDRPFQPEDLARVEERMRTIVTAGQSFSRREVSDEQARAELALEPYKLELIGLKGSTAGHDDISVEVGTGNLTIYDNIDPASGHTVWKDLCRGPHLPSTRHIPAFKLMRSAAAYWRGSEKNAQLQRVYGTAWESKESLATYLHLLDEAERRDHRKVGKDLELFHFEPTAPGMPYWLPKGLRILNNLLAFWREEHEARGYEEIATPLVNNKRLWEISGHWDHYRENMFTIESDGDEASSYALKPMNCPNAMIVFNVKTRSYRDLPLRLSDCDPLHRNERSGTLHGLLRVQKLTQDDAHIFITPDQIREECQRVFDIADRFYGIFGLDYTFRLGTRPESFIGDIETWDDAEATLKSILDARTGGRYELENGGGAFYGPKMDILMSDALGRSWQMGTIQLDFQLPRRFGCVYTDEHGQRQTPVVIHRVIYGALERFLGILIEHTAGAFPLWLSPVQVSIIPVASEHAGYAQKVADTLRQARVRVDLDARNETLGMRVRIAQQQKVPLMLVLGGREAQDGTVSVRRRSERTLTTMDLDLFVDRVASAVRTRVDADLPTDAGS
ncbi:MAG: threonine--tRNA ligase [Pseudonocardiaceae bacterium]